VWVLDERFGVGSVVGLAMILFGSWLGARGRSEARAMAPSEEGQTR